MDNSIELESDHYVRVNGIRYALAKITGVRIESNRREMLPPFLFGGFFVVLLVIYWSYGGSSFWGNVGLAFLLVAPISAFAFGSLTMVRGGYTVCIVEGSSYTTPINQMSRTRAEQVRKELQRLIAKYGKAAHG